VDFGFFLKLEQPIADDLGVKNPDRVNLQSNSKEAVFPQSTNYRYSDDRKD